MHGPEMAHSIRLLPLVQAIAIANVTNTIIIVAIQFFVAANPFTG